MSGDIMRMGASWFSEFAKTIFYTEVSNRRHKSRAVEAVLKNSLAPIAPTGAFAC